MLGKPTGWANQSKRGWHGQTAQNPCKSYSSTAYIDVGTFVRFCTTEMLLLQGLHLCTPWSNSFFARFCVTKCYSSSVWLHSPPAPCYMCYMCYMDANPLNLHSPRVPCYMCYMCYISQGNPPNIHSPRVPCYMCHMCYILHAKPLNPHSPPAPCYMYYMCYMFCTREICTICAI